jgi:serine/threonine-protein phosphatase 2A regulatory subunit B
MTASFFRHTKQDTSLEAAQENNKPHMVLKLHKICAGGKRKKDEVSGVCLDFSRKILHTAWHPRKIALLQPLQTICIYFQTK